MEQCSVCLRNENLYPLECSHRLCLQCVKGVCTHGGRCPLCRAEFSGAYKHQVGTAPATLQDFGASVQERVSAMLLPGGAWAYGDRKNINCWLYDETIQREIQEADSRTDSPRVFYTTACGSVIKIDLDARKQVNVTTRAVRKLRKCSTVDTGVIKGIAGMPK